MREKTLDSGGGGGGGGGGGTENIQDFLQGMAADVVAAEARVDTVEASISAGKTSADAKAMEMAEFLAANRLESFMGALTEAGALEIGDLCELSEEELTELGMKRLEAKRLRRSLAPAAAGE